MPVRSGPSLGPEHRRRGTSASERSVTGLDHLVAAVRQHTQPLDDVAVDVTSPHLGLVAGRVHRDVVMRAVLVAGLFDPVSGVSVTTQSFSNGFVGRSAFDAAGTVRFIGTNFDLTPGDAYLFNMNTGYADRLWLPPHF